MLQLWLAKIFVPLQGHQQLKFQIFKSLLVVIS